MSLADLYEGGASGPLNIPKARFIDDVNEFVKEKDLDKLVLVARELLERYLLMDRNLQHQKAVLLSKVPDIEKSIESVQMLQSMKGGNMKYKLAELTYAEATVEKPENVYLWLGANVLLEYTYPEALTLLNANREKAQTKLEDLNNSIQFLKRQTTVTEVNIARLHNYRCELRKTAPAQ